MMVKASHRSFFVNEECIICNRKIDGKKSSNLRRHLERFHPQELAAFDRASPSTRSKKDEIPADKGSELQNELVDFFISSRIPLENLYNEHFRKLLNAIPNFTIPTLEEVQIQMALKLIPPVETGTDKADMQVDLPEPVKNQ